MSSTPVHPKVRSIIGTFSELKRKQEELVQRYAKALRPHEAVFERIAEQERIFERMAEQFSPIVAKLSELDDAAKVHRRILNAGATLEMLEKFTGSRAAMAKAFESVRELSDVLEKIQNYQIPSVTLFSPDTADIVAHIARGSSFESAAYRGFFRVKKAESAVVEDVRAIPPDTATLPSRETFLAGQSAIVAQSQLRDSFGTKVKTEGQSVATVMSLDELFERELFRLGPNLGRMLTGARFAIGSDNPDRLRQASASLREFLKGALRHLAPDREFLAWTKTESITQKDAKKLETRIRFVIRNAPSPTELSFYQIDAAQLRLLLNHFNEGVHWDSARFSEGHLPTLVRRVEGFVATLIEIDRAYNRGHEP